MSISAFGTECPFDVTVQRLHDPECAEHHSAVGAYQRTSSPRREWSRPNERENDMTNLNNETRELTTDELNDASGGRSDLGQQLQLALQEANNIFTRASKAQSDVSAKYSQSLDGIAQNFK
jgi:hypothetical protein